MVGVEVKEVMTDLMIDNTPEHLCYSCAVGYLLLLLEETKDLSETTQDVNLCALFARDDSDKNIPRVCDEVSGNTRVYLSGLQTIDNGSGYWVVGCPHRIPYPFDNIDDLIDEYKYRREMWEVRKNSIKERKKELE